MRLTFYGGAKSVTGANYLLEADHEGQPFKILIDCGLHQGSSFCEKHNFEPFAYDPKEIRAVFVTHAHIDHTGRLPQLYRGGFRGKVYSTDPTRDFAHVLLLDSEHILKEDAKRFKKELTYTTEDINELMKLWKGVEYHEPLQIGPFTISLQSAGHILGSSSIIIEGPAETGGKKKKIVFSGDLGNSPAPIIGPREEIPSDADYCLMESTYGGRIHEPIEERDSILEELIKDTINSKGTLMIPAFAMERTQQLLFILNDLVEKKSIPAIPVFLDSPLAIHLTEIYRRYERFFIGEHVKRHIAAGDEIFDFPGLRTTLTTEESKSINGVSAPKVVIAGAGMSNAGRILHHEVRYLPDPQSTLLIVGYQAKGSLGRMLLDKKSPVRIMGQSVEARAKVRAIGGFSAHADQPQLLKWLAPARESIKKVYLVQGEEDQALALAVKIKSEFNLEAIVPEDAATINF
jgi:metallo-beta-lactamase family protein